MALPWPVQDGIDLMAGRHALSRYIAPLLWLTDAVLTSLIIWKVPCKFGRQCCAFISPGHV